MVVTGVILSVLVFLFSHSLTARPRFRAAGERLLGRVGWILAYSALSLALLAWVIVEVRDAPIIQLWPQESWMRWAPALAMPFACILAVAGLTSPNPFSLGPGGRGFDPARPGILRLTRHPVLWAAVLWAAAHVLPNGHAAALILFVPLLLLGLLGMRVVAAKRPAVPANMGGLRWVMLREIGPWRPLGGLVLYAALMHLHEKVIGLSPMP